jgi:hypothetical protein
VKARFTPADIANYRTPIWSTRLFGDLYERGGYFGDDLSELIDLSGRLKRYQAAITSLTTADSNHSIPILNRSSLEFLGLSRPVYVTDLASGQYEVALIGLNNQADQLQAAVKNRGNAFFAQYGVTFDGTPPPPEFDTLPLFTPADSDVCPRW